MKKKIIDGVIFGALIMLMLALGILAYNIALQGNNIPIITWLLESSIISLAGINITIKERNKSG